MKDCKHNNDWEWKDCNAKGHDEGCFMLVCPDCGAYDRDCEEGNE